MYNLLKDPIIRVQPYSEPLVHASLPEIFALMATDQVSSIPAVRPHQRQAWHAFLVQLGTMALSNLGLTELPTKADIWQLAIRSLTPDHADDEPWHILGQDVHQPAFMQPPVPQNGPTTPYKRCLHSPSTLDILITSKNHDIKHGARNNAALDDWIMAMITCQTMGGFEGRRVYGIARMNKGFGNRPSVSLTPAGGPGAHMRRDIHSLLQNDRSDHQQDISLLWTQPWSGREGDVLDPQTLHPLHIEICRRIRMQADQAQVLHCMRAATEQARVTLTEIPTYDPWAPINTKTGHSLTTAFPNPFHFSRIANYLTSNEWEWPDLLKPTAEETRDSQPMTLLARTLVRGQGETQGFYQRSVPLDPQTVLRISTEEGRRTLGTIAQERIQLISAVRQALSTALRTFIAKGSTEDARSIKAQRVAPIMRPFDQQMDDTFFIAIQHEFNIHDDDQRKQDRRQWLSSEVIAKAFQAFEQAVANYQAMTPQKQRAAHKARTVMENMIRRNRTLSQTLRTRTPAKAPTRE